MTPPTHGWKLMRDAALSLALEHKFAGELANPRQFIPYNYSESSAILDDTDKNFLSGPRPGEILPETRLDRGYLTDLLGKGFTVLCFNVDFANSLSNTAPKSIFVVHIPRPSKASKLLNAENNSAYLVRPDGYIAARWKQANSDKVIEGFFKIIYQKLYHHVWKHHQYMHRCQFHPQY